MDGNRVSADHDLHGRVIAILAAQALRAPGDLTPEMRLADLGIDSLGLAEVIFSIEEGFDVQVPFNANVPGDLDLGTVGAVCEAIQALVRAPRP